MCAMASQITSLAIVYSTVYSTADQRKHQSSASLAFVRGILRWPVNSPHKRPVTRKMFPFDDVIMTCFGLKTTGLRHPVIAESLALRHHIDSTVTITPLYDYCTTCISRNSHSKYFGRVGNLLVYLFWLVCIFTLNPSMQWLSTCFISYPQECVISQLIPHDVIKWNHFLRYWSFVRGIHRVTGEFPPQSPVTRSFDLFLDLRLNKRLSKQSWSWWFETPSIALIMTSL